MRHYQGGGIIACRALLDLYRAGIDVETRMLALSTYLGHVNPVMSSLGVSTA